jgi:VWFA-related protein
MRFLRSSFDACLLLAMAGGPFILAQEHPTLHVPPSTPAAAPAGKSSKPFVVSLPLSAWDKHGKQVTNLDRNDLTLTDEGQTEVIQSLTQDHNLPFKVGLLDDTSSSMKNIIDADRKGGESFVDQMLGTQKPVASVGGMNVPLPAETSKNEIFLLHFDREVELLQDFTSDPTKLHNELDEMGPTSKSKNDSQGPETMGDDRSSAHGVPGGSNLYDAIFLASDEVMKDKQGRKALILVSDGLDKGSKETMNDALDAAERAHVIVYTIYLAGNQSEHNPLDNTGRHRGYGYPGSNPGGYPTGNPSGGRPPAPTGAAADGRKIMQRIAERTGALYFDAKRKEDLPEIYGIIAKDLEGLYTITYTPSKMENDGMFHKVVLKTTNKDLRLTIPEGYFAPGGDSDSN